MQPAIRVENLGKRYYLHHARQREGYRTLRESLVGLAAAPVRRWRNGGSGDQREAFWALDDVSFDIQPGEVVGIIGRNGAGKSTLLKVLSRITRPTTGRVELRGRVGSLLEVGTGFHPELTGRENIYLNGSILGMSRREVARKFDEIVAFSGVEAFLDTPVKRYSSGMQVRLAFAVAAHLEPEILIIDEVLAVGDAAFQRKCLGQMERVAQSGRTVLFVSHSMGAVEGLCSRGIVMDAGRVAFAGTQVEAIRRYMALNEHALPLGRYTAPETGGDDSVICEATVTSGGEYSAAGYAVGAPLEFFVRCRASRRLSCPSLGIGIDDAMGQRVVTLHTEFGPCSRRGAATRDGVEFTCRMGTLALRPGEYRAKISFEDGPEPLHVIEEAFRFHVQSGDYYENGGRIGRGVVLCEQSWEVWN